MSIMASSTTTYRSFGKKGEEEKNHRSALPRPAISMPLGGGLGVPSIFLNRACRKKKKKEGPLDPSSLLFLKGKKSLAGEGPTQLLFFSTNQEGKGASQEKTIPPNVKKPIARTNKKGEE